MLFTCVASADTIADTVKTVNISNLNDVPGYSIKEVEKGKLEIQTPTGGIQTVYQNYQTGEVRVVESIENVEIINPNEINTAGIISPMGTTPFSGSVAPKTNRLYGPYHVNAGQKLSCGITWVPSNQGLALTIVPENETNIIIAPIYSGGAASISETAPRSGGYYIYVGGSTGNTQTVNYQGYITYP
jgi:hypothetical protein